MAISSWDRWCSGLFCSQVKKAGVKEQHVKGHHVQPTMITFWISISFDRTGLLVEHAWLTEGLHTLSPDIKQTLRSIAS